MLIRYRAKQMQHPILVSKISNQLKKWMPYKSWKYPRDLLKSIPEMCDEQLYQNLVEINLCAYYNPDVLQMLNNKMIDKGFYLMNRHILQNLINTYSRQKGLDEKIRLICKKFDDIFINGTGFGDKQAQQKVQLLKQQIKSDNLLQSMTTSSSIEMNKQSTKIKNYSSVKGKFIEERKEFILALSHISNKLFECKEGKTQDEINFQKQKIFNQAIIELNQKIQQFQKDENNLNPCIFYYKNDFHHVKQINLEKSSFIPTKNRNPLKLDFGFSSFIYKNDDQLAHEIIAMQFIKYLNKIFDKQYIQEYIIIPQNKGALYEYVKEAKTVAQIKKQHQDLPNYIEFLSKNQGIELSQLRKRFAQSYAGYCIAEFMLEIKDRNNSNLMLKDDGTFFHIDLAFIFNAKPGGISFESAPFKMTKQYVKVMGGFDSDNFKYFESLLIQLITKIYESKDQYLCKLDILGSRSKEIRCFNGFDIQKYKNSKIVKSLDQARLFVQDLIDKSFDSWCTKNYDTYQWKTNKIPA